MSFLGIESKKNDTEKAFDAARKQYEEHFGKPYVFQVGFGGDSMKETTEEILRMIEKDEEQKLDKYDAKAVY